MPSVDLGKLYDGMQQEMEAGLKTGASVLMHPGMKGDDTEDNWREWLMAYLPNRYAVAKGVVIDADGNESEQIDVIIYDRQYSYAVCLAAAGLRPRRCAGDRAQDLILTAFSSHTAVGIL